LNIDLLDTCLPAGRFIIEYFFYSNLSNIPDLECPILI